jgi:hypothetical protein
MDLVHRRARDRPEPVSHGRRLTELAA